MTRSVELADGDTAECRHCGEQIVYKLKVNWMTHLHPHWYHTKIIDWPERGTVQYMLTCPNPYEKPIADPTKEDWLRLAKPKEAT
jgi:DNA-directed RNA polymerase subunit RPC12/RpoP